MSLVKKLGKPVLRAAQNTDSKVRMTIRQLRTKMLRPRQSDKEMLVLSASGNSHGLTYPYHFYRKSIYESFGLLIREIESDSLSSKHKAVERFDGDIVMIAPPQRGPDGIMFPREQIHDFFRNLPTKPGQKRILFDVSDGPTGRHFECAPLVDLYAMSFTYTDPEDYFRDFLAGHKFADFAARHYGLDPTPENEYWPGKFDSKLAPDELPKLHTLHRIGSRKAMHKQFRSQGSRCIIGGSRTIDVHCRFNSYSGWCRAHRYHVRDELKALEPRYRIVASEEKVPRPEYFREILGSKILFSPFGWGEFCPKDWEAFLSGCLLMKPSVEHVTTCPQILIPYETYVPVAWDLSDMHEKVAHYIANERERNRIVDNARQVVMDFYDEKNFVATVGAMLKRLDVEQ